MESQTTKEVGIYTRKRILQYVIHYIQEHGYSPSVREIGDGVGLNSTSSVQTQLQKMLETGQLESDAPLGTHRALRVPGWKFVREDENE